MAEPAEAKFVVRQEEPTPVSDPGSSSYRPSTRLRWILAGLGLLVAVALFALGRYYSIRETTDAAQIEAHIHPLGARVGGTVLRVLVNDNQPVKAGTILVQLDPRDYQVAVARAQADLAEAEALWRAGQVQVPITSETTISRLADTQAGVEEARARLAAAQKDAEAARTQLAMAQARLRQEQANAEKAAKDLERMKLLIAKEEISQQQYDATVAAAEGLRAAVDAAQAAVNTAQLGIPAADSRVQSEQARLAQAEAILRGAQTAPQQVAAIRARAESARANADRAKAALDQAQLNLEYTTLRAPLDGIVSKKSVEVGQTVQPGQSLLAIVPLEEIWITANFKETQLHKMRPGQKVLIAVDAYGGRTYEGRVDSIAAASGAKFSLLPPENASGNFVKVVQRVPVKIILEKGQDPEHLLRAGMSVVPTVITE